MRGLVTAVALRYNHRMATDRRLLRFARQNRRETGLAETLLWNELRGRQLGPRFRRQDPQGPFIADFTWRSHKLVIEVDDWSHDDPEKDRSRGPLGG